MENKDLKYLKKHYGENFAHLCRTLFPTILEEEGKLSKIISENFADSHSLYDALKESNTTSEFKNYIYSKFHINKKIECKGFKSPYELFDKAGYILYPECETEEDIQKFKKYYKDNEKLCTFNGGRLDYCRVWFAVKKNVDEIKRENFKNPRRQDEYGTSVISIQYTKEGGCLSIKNRYNHMVLNPDATFSNNLDNIAIGLTNAFEKKFEICSVNSEEVGLSKYNFVKAPDGKFYKYNVVNNGIYYCENNVIIDQDSEIINLDKSSKILIDDIIVDLKQKKIYSYYYGENDSFVRSVGEIRDIKVFSRIDSKGKVIEVYPKEGEKVEIKIDRFNQIEEYINPNVVYIEYGFLEENRGMKKVVLENVMYINDDFLRYNKSLKEFIAPKLKHIRNNFLLYNRSLENLDLPELETTQNLILPDNKVLTKLNLPKLKSIGNHVLESINVTELNFPNLRDIGSHCFTFCEKVKKVELPKVEKIGDNFLNWCFGVEYLNAPNLEYCSKGFIKQNLSLLKNSKHNLDLDYFLTK